MRRFEVVAIIITAFVVLGTPAVVFGYEAFLRSQTQHEFTIVGRDGTWNPATIRVKQGDKVKLRLTSDDVAHGFSAPDLGIDVPEIYPGKFVEVEFVADKAGTYSFFCTVLCSPQHGSMKGEIVVDDGSGQAPPAAAPASVVDAGKSLYQNKCAACHGQKGEGGIGPGLTGTTADRIASQVRTPKGAMPSFPSNLLSDDDLKKLTDYIGSLGK